MTVVRDAISEAVEEHYNESVILADGLEDAFVGVARRFGWTQPVAVYDYRKCIEIFEERDDMSQEQAVEFFEFNVIGAWVGDQTPIFVDSMAD